MTAELTPRRYTLEPLDTSGVFLGLAPAQCILVGGGLTLAVLALSGGMGLGPALLPLVIAVPVSFGRLGGHPAWAWLPLAARWMLGRLRGRRWFAPLPLLPGDGSARLSLPPCLAGLEVVSIPWRGTRCLGVVHDRQSHTLTALVPVSGAPFVLETSDDQERSVSAWGDVLAQFAGAGGGGVSHVFWSDLSRPLGSQADAGQHDPPGDDAGLDPVASYRRLLDEASAAVSSHETIVGVAVGDDGGRRGSRSSDQESQGRAIAAAVDGLMRGLGAAGLIVGNPLDVIGLHRLLRHRLDPLDTAADQSTGHGLVDRLGLVTPTSSGPLVVEPGWRSLRVDGAWHRTWWVASWPRSPVPAGWMEGFLSATGVARTMTVTFKPVPGHRSRRRIERDLVKLESDAAAKQEKGRRVDARHERATQSLLDREAELVAGYAEMAYVGLVGVCARSEAELDEQSGVVVQLARQVGMDLRVLDGRQDLAWAAALPLGLAPRSLVGT